MRYVLLSLLAVVILGLSGLHASIINTKHNLSISNTAGTIKAQTETEVCVFCHIPHQARPEGKPLWNRSMPTSNYIMYDSDYLRRMGYPEVALDLGSTNDTPGALSRQCLSCHDGTVAVGAVYKLRRQVMNGSTIAMSGVDAGGNIPSSASGFLGTDLTMHHPVGIEYDPTVTKNFDIGTRTIELKASPDAPIKLFEYGGKRYVECSSCHDPHKANKMFLRAASGANHAQNVVATCTSCHDKLTWTGSVHQTATATYSDPNILTTYGSNKVGDLGCANCHTPHNAEGIPYINRKVQAATCFEGAASSTSGAACHGIGGAKDIESVLSRLYTHPVNENTVNPKHTNLDTLYGTGVSDPNGGGGISWDTNKHAVCMDCHNPHKARPGKHVPDGQWYPSPGAGTNLVSGVLQGVSGVEPTWPAAWTQPLTFSTMESATKEYQICFKCHSYWGLGSATNGINDGGHVSPSDGVTPLTDVAWEMNINNKSGHPVVINSLGRVGSYNPKALQDFQLLTPWKENPGLNTMYCSDCHGADNELGGDPRGPHGSNLKYILKGENQHWPFDASGRLYRMGDIGTSADTGLFCKNCHDLSYPHQEWWRRMSRINITCVSCHVTVPHGSPVSRLIGYSNFPIPYNYNGNSLRIQGFRKNDFFDNRDVYAPGCGGRRCHRTNDGGYDLNPFP